MEGGPFSSFWNIRVRNNPKMAKKIFNNGYFIISLTQIAISSQTSDPTYFLLRIDHFEILSYITPLNCTSNQCESPFYSWCSKFINLSINHFATYADIEQRLLCRSISFRSIALLQREPNQRLLGKETSQQRVELDIEVIKRSTFELKIGAQRN